MKIKNDYIKVISPSKKIKIYNTILQPYIDAIRIRISIKDYNVFENSFMINTIFLKFDEKLTFDMNSILNYSDFDIFDNNKLTSDYIELGSNYSLIRRIFSVEKDYWKRYNEGQLEQISDFSEYIGRKITAIGFGNIYTETKETNIFACVDTSNYNIYFDKNMIFSRQDTIKSDQIFTGFEMKGYLGLFLGYTRPPLVKSIGIGYSYDKMDYETTNFEIVQGTNTVTFKTINNAEKEGLFPRKNLYPSINLYPNTQTARYFIIKYGSEKVDKYYYVATPINNKTGDLELTITIERG